MADISNHAWLIEAPGQRYLGVREIGRHPHFFWTTDHERGLRFWNQSQADMTMMAVRCMDPSLFAFAANLGDARPIEHGWLAPKESTPDTGPRGDGAPSASTTEPAAVQQSGGTPS